MAIVNLKLNVLSVQMKFTNLLTMLMFGMKACNECMTETDDTENICNATMAIKINHSFETCLSLGLFWRVSDILTWWNPLAAVNLQPGSLWNFWKLLGRWQVSACWLQEWGLVLSAWYSCVLGHMMWWTIQKFGRTLWSKVLSRTLQIKSNQVVLKQRRREFV